MHGLTVVASKGDGSCQFSSVARGLRMGGVNRLPGETYVGTPAVRRCVSRHLLEDNLADYEEVWKAMPGSDLERALRAADGTAQDKLSRIRQTIESTKPVMYQGDDFSLGALSKQLEIDFIVFRSDGTIQGGMPDLGSSRRIMMLLFTDFEDGGAAGSTHGHYDLLVHGTRSLFTLRTLPSELCKFLADQGVRTHAQKQTKEEPQQQQQQQKEKPPEDATHFPMLLEQRPGNSAEWMAALIMSLESMPERMDILFDGEGLWQQYKASCMGEDAYIGVQLSGQGGLRSFLAEVSVDDHFDGRKHASQFSCCDTQELIDYVLSSMAGAGCDDAVVDIKVCVADKGFVEIHNIDKAL